MSSGPSGLTDEDFIEIDRAAVARSVGVVAVGNFAVAAMLLQRFACEAGRHLTHWEIIDYASDRKVDAPSGTARELAYLLSQVRQPEVTLPVEATLGPSESRGATLSGSQVHSLRLPSYTIGLEVIFGGADERLTIRYDAGTGPEPYLQGTLRAIRLAKATIGLVRGSEEVLKAAVIPSPGHI